MVPGLDPDLILALNLTGTFVFGLSVGVAAVKALIRDHLERASRGETAREDPLSPRESEIVKLIAARRRSSAIAQTSATSSACATAPS